MIFGQRPRLLAREQLRIQHRQFTALVRQELNAHLWEIKRFHSSSSELCAARLSNAPASPCSFASVRNTPVSPFKVTFISFSKPIPFAFRSIVHRLSRETCNCVSAAQGLNISLTRDIGRTADVTDIAPGWCLALALIS